MLFRSCGCHNERELAKHLVAERHPRKCPIARLLRAGAQLGIDIHLPKCLSLGKEQRDTSWFGLKVRIQTTCEGRVPPQDIATVINSWNAIYRRLSHGGRRTPRQIFDASQPATDRWRLPKELSRNPRWLEPLRRVLTGMDETGLFPPLDRGEGFPSTAIHQALVHDALRALETASPISPIFQDRRWLHIRSSALFHSWNTHLTTIFRQDWQALPMLPHTAGRRDPVHALIALGLVADSEPTVTRTILRELIRWIAPHLRSGPSRAMMDVTPSVQPLSYWLSPLSTSYITFHTADNTAGVQQFGEYTVSTTHGIVHISRGTEMIGSVSSTRWRLLIQDFQPADILKALPTWISQVEHEENTVGIPSSQFWHGLRKTLLAPCVLGCNALVAPSVFPMALRNWTTPEGWGWAQFQLADTWLPQGFLLNLLTANAQEQQDLCAYLSRHPQWFVLTRARTLSLATKNMLTAHGHCLACYPRGSLIAASKGSWRKSSPRAIRSREDWYIWASSAAIADEGYQNRLKKALRDIPLTSDGVVLPDPSDPDCREIDLGPFGSLYQRSGVIVATDGSLRKDGAMGAAFVSLQGKLPPKSAAVHGSKLSMRPEMVAILMAVETCPPDTALTILTDSLSSIDLLQDLQREDFTVWIYHHPLRCIVEQLVRRLNARAALHCNTHFVKVKAHSGEPMNELADALASQAAELSDTYQLELNPEAVYFYSQGTPMEWNTRLKRQLTQTAAARFTRSRLARAESPGHTTVADLSKTAQWLIRTGQGRKQLGLYMQSAPIDNGTKQVLQTIAGTFPSQRRLFQWKIADTPTCPLCGQADETQSHIQCVCPALQRARIRAHHRLAQHLWSGITRVSTRGFEVYIEHTVASLRGLPASPAWYHDWQRMCDHLDSYVPDSLEYDETDSTLAGGLGRKRPDAWAINWRSAKLYILEFTRPSDTSPTWDTSTDDYKKAKYQPICDRIHLLMPNWTVEVLPFSFGIRGSFNERVWKHNLDKFGISISDSDKLMSEMVEINKIGRAHV